MADQQKKPAARKPTRTAKPPAATPPTPPPAVNVQRAANAPALTKSGPGELQQAESGLLALLQRRPTETVTGLALAASVYGFLTQAGVATAAAALIAVAIAFLPALVTSIVDAVRR